MLLVGMLAIAFLWAGSAGAETSPCRAGISAETAARIFAILKQPLAEADCKLEGVSTSGSRLEARWSRGGAGLPAVSMVPLECAPPGATAKGAFVIEVPPELTRSCPSIAPLIAELTKQIETEAPAGRFGSIHDPLFRAARALFAAIAIVIAVLSIRGALRLPSLDRRWLFLGAAGFVAALVVRAALPFSLGNWYSEVMPASGPPPWMRFGPGYFAFQSLLRDLWIWGPHALAVSQLVIGAAAVPILLGILRLLHLGLDASAAALLLLILAPFHARLSATSSEHVLASTACLGLLFCWMRAARTGDRLWFGAALLLFPAVCAIRVDMAVQASVTLAWPFLLDRLERSGVRRWPPAGMATGLAVIAVATLLLAYRLIALPSRHPMPEWTWHVFALRHFAPQFWILATGETAWISLSSVLLAIVGGLSMTVRRPLLLVRVAGTLLVAFVASGRSFLHDELLGARYFLFTIPILVIASGYGFETLLGLVGGRFRAVAATLGICCLAGWTFLAARPAYTERYAFQDEYAFARAALAQLPAGCAVYQVPIRSAALPHDVDCCLDVARSPLVLEFPALRFLDLPDETATVLTRSACTAYYEGAACAITPGPTDRLGYEFAAKAAAYFQRRCAEAHGLGRLELLEETTTSPRTTEDFFGTTRPRVRLYRWAR